MKINIVGGGIGGLIAALCLARGSAGNQTAHEITVFEQGRDDALTGGGAGIQLSPNAMHVMSHLDLSLDELATEPAAGSLRHYRTGELYYRSPMGQAYLSLYGASYLHVHRADLVRFLQNAARSRGVRLCFSSRVTGYEQDAERVRIQLTDDSWHEADLLIGADGLHSVVRAAGQDARFTGQIAWRGLVQASLLADGLLPYEANVWLGPGQHFVAYYVRGGRWVSFVGVQEGWQQIDAQNLPQAAAMADVRAAFAGWHPLVQAILQACTDCQLWSLFDRPPLATWAEGRVVLLGDACHPMLPFMAQGAAMAMEDAYVLAYALQNQPNLPVALATYEEERKARVHRLYVLSRRNARLFHAKTVWARALRSLQFTVARALPELAQRHLGRIYGFNVTKRKHKNE